ncbi:hypothetical protein DCAR_0208398 [Daucus carota subsp. sativus]|uniref:DDE Tnp4 domain-containing protein n=1 Tax=Daucus carota subsp. sativus TaxID=79200 RepID=A0AAF1AQH0_DAUCS|nr:hypothetical protein DCAR_0208398 [Daucus carota subsp. sativus]
MTIPVEDRPKYRNRRGEITTNVLGACSPNLQFQYVLTGWEGSAADGRVLRDAIYRHRLIVTTEFDQAEIEFDQHGPEDHHEQNEHEADEDHITTIGTSDAWTTFRNNLADSMFNSWNH